MELESGDVLGVDFVVIAKGIQCEPLEKIEPTGSIPLAKDGSYLVDGGTHIRLINRTLGWTLPLEGPKTLSGLIIEQLETIPDSSCCISLEVYHIEIVQIQDNMIKTARLEKAPEPELDHEE